MFDPMDMMQRLASMKSPEKSYDLKTVAVMNDREAQEFRAMKVTATQVNKELSALKNREDELEARQTLFWAALRRARPELTTAEFLYIEEIADKYEIQTGPKKACLENPFENPFGNNE